jgi:hypothetical protein
LFAMSCSISSDGENYFLLRQPKILKQARATDRR